MTKLHDGLPAVWLRVIFGDFIRLFVAAFLAAVNDLPAFGLFLHKTMRKHDSTTAALAVARQIVKMQRDQTKGTMIAETAVL